MDDNALSQLPADEQLVVKLLLESGRSHAEIADFLGIDEQVVRDRAQSAFESLNQVTSAEPNLAPQAAKSKKPEPKRIQARPKPKTRADDQEVPISKRGGIILLAGVLLIGVVLIIIFVARGGKDSPTKATTTTATTATSKSSTTPNVLATVKLTSPNASSSAVGAAQIVKSGPRIGIVLAAQKVKPSGSRDAYAVWLTDGSSAPKRLGFAQPVKKDGNLSGIAELPDGYQSYGKIVVSRETTQQPTTPGPTVLQGSLSG